MSNTENINTGKIDEVTKGEAAKNETAVGGSPFAQERAASAGGGAATGTAMAASQPVTQQDYAAYKNGKLFTEYLNRRIIQTPQVLLKHDGHDLIVVDLQDNGLACYERGTDVKHLVPLDERALDMILPQVLKS